MFEIVQNTAHCHSPDNYFFILIPKMQAALRRQEMLAFFTRGLLFFGLTARQACRPQPPRALSASIVPHHLRGNNIK
jgi:hypothetical protein